MKTMQELIKTGEIHGSRYDRREPAWKPFATAPQNGTEILVFRPDAGVFVAIFESPSYFINDDDDEPDWFSITGEHLCGNELPTHWMPMPQEPV